MAGKKHLIPGNVRQVYEVPCTPSIPPYPSVIFRLLSTSPLQRVIKVINSLWLDHTKRSSTESNNSCPVWSIPSETWHIFIQNHFYMRLLSTYLACFEEGQAWKWLRDSVYNTHTRLRAWDNLRSNKSCLNGAAVVENWKEVGSGWDSTLYKPQQPLLELWSRNLSAPFRI